MSFLELPVLPLGSSWRRAWQDVRIEPKMGAVLAQRSFLFVQATRGEAMSVPPGCPGPAQPMIANDALAHTTLVLEPSSDQTCRAASQKEAVQTKGR